MSGTINSTSLPPSEAMIPQGSHDTWVSEERHGLIAHCPSEFGTDNKIKPEIEPVDDVCVMPRRQEEFRKSAGLTQGASNITLPVALPTACPPLQPDFDGYEDSSPKKKRRTNAWPARIRRVGRVPARDEQAAPTAADDPLSFKVHSKHDEKWNQMFRKLVEYKQLFNTTLVPQCYDHEPRLGRWVHYQRVEYWLYQSQGKAKINAERIARLDSIGFEWDPQKAQWEQMFSKLQTFGEEHGHCKVPKGYTKDPELANWVRNQRLEYANMRRGKKTRMTQDRLKRLEALGFRWSNSKYFWDSKRSDSADQEGADGQATAPSNVEPCSNLAGDETTGGDDAVVKVEEMIGMHEKRIDTKNADELPASTSVLEAV